MTIQELIDEALPSRPPGARPDLGALLGAPGSTLIVLATSRDVNAKMSVLVVPPNGDAPATIVKVPTTEVAARAVEAEGRLLCALRRQRLRVVDRTLPRYVRVYDAGGLPAVATTVLRGTPMRTIYHGWLHTSWRPSVRRDFAMAADWLASFQRESARGAAAITLLVESLAALARRWPDDERVREIHRRLEAPAARLAAERAPCTAVHGDYWHGNLLVADGAIAGVVDWECGAVRGDPTRDIARFPLSYALYLDRHTPPGWPVVGHPGLYARSWGAGVEYALLGKGWFAELVRGFVAAALDRLGASPALWREVLLGGVAEVAATTDHPDFAEQHLGLLVRLARRLEDRPR